MTNPLTIEILKERARLVLLRDPSRKDAVKQWLNDRSIETVQDIPPRQMPFFDTFIRTWEIEDADDDIDDGEPLKLTEKVGPVQEVKTRKIVNGRYGLIDIRSDDLYVTAEMRLVILDNYNAPRLREAIAHLTAIADFLEADDGV